MYKKNLLIVASILLVGTTLLCTPFVGGGIASMDNDGFWRDCQISIENFKIRGCYVANFMFPKLTPEEQEFKKKLDAISHPPTKVTKADIVHIMGKEPDQIVELMPGAGRYQWNNFGPGTKIDRGLVIRIYQGQLHEVQWMQPNRFYLNKGLRTRHD